MIESLEKLLVQVDELESLIKKEPSSSLDWKDIMKHVLKIKTDVNAHAMDAETKEVDQHQSHE